jgi:hypothetical protein
LAPLPSFRSHLRHLESTGWRVWLVGVFGGALLMWTWLRLDSFLIVSPILAIWSFPIHPCVGQASPTSEGTTFFKPEQGGRGPSSEVEAIGSRCGHDPPEGLLLWHQDLPSDPPSINRLLRLTRLELLQAVFLVYLLFTYCFSFL